MINHGKDVRYSMIQRNSPRYRKYMLALIGVCTAIILLVNL